MDSLEDRLKPILTKIAKENTIVVMVCNNGVLDLMMNFVCSARARNLDISNLLVFATDEETRTALTSMNIAVFDDEGAVGDIPKKEAKVSAARENVEMFVYFSLSHMHNTCCFRREGLRRPNFLETDVCKNFGPFLANDEWLQRVVPGCGRRLARESPALLP